MIMSDSASLPGNESSRLRHHEAVTDPVLASLSFDDLLTELLERLRGLLHVDTAAILLLDPSGRELVATAATGLEEEVRQGLRVPLGHGFTGRVAQTLAPIVIDHVDAETVFSPVLIDKHLTAMAGVPMLAEGRLTGVLHVGSRAARRFTDDDLDLIRMVADRAAIAARARLSIIERDATLALQRSLLSVLPPVITGLHAASRYVPGAEVGVGGDWYDVFELPSGHIGLVIGDVAGNGLRAAVIMGRIRSALRAYSLETNDPADVLTRLDHKIQFFEPSAMATACYAVISPDRTRVVLSSAGHLPPIVCGCDGAAAAPVPPDLPLGAIPGAHRRTTTLDLPLGCGLLFYTDGLIERRDRILSESITQLAKLVGYGDADQICQRAIGILDHDPASDDVALLAVTRTG
jgi:sigma-B regulation protein RsbU (phosphoserine phosphatase)